ncbi:MAG: FtsX-like permease family protein [Candidatus Aegiribacteria sp.]|nr:FtsX-like permease family protein [Candidatus Aegiribacteria sp.]
MKFSLVIRIAMRQIFSRSNSGFVRTVSSLSIAGIAIGVAALVILNSFMDGFSTSILKQLSSIHPPMEVRIPGGFPLEPDDIRFAANLAAMSENITFISPVLEKTAVAAGNSGDVAGVRVRGVDWDVEPSLVSGERLSNLNISGQGAVAVLGTALSERLGVSRGDTIRLASTDATQFSAMGRLLVDTIVSVSVSAVTDFGIDEYNSAVIITDLTTASLLFRDPVSATSLSVGLSQEADPVSEAESMSATLRESYIAGESEYMVCSAFISTHRNLFAALGLEKLGMTIVLALISVVAMLNLLSALNMIAIEHRRDTGVLRSMGASPEMIISTGLMQGGIIGLSGALAGSIFAVVAITLINNFFPIRLESSVYWIDVLPGQLQPLLILSIGFATVAACFIASLFPALHAIKVSPSEAVRYE